MIFIIINMVRDDNRDNQNYTPLLSLVFKSFFLK